MGRLERPLDPSAVSAADDQLYAAHASDPRPNALYAADGSRQPLDPNDPSQAALRQEWRAHYLANGGREEGQPPDREPSDSPVETCPLEETANLVVRVVESANNATIAGATVSIVGPSGVLEATSNEQGFATFEDIEPGLYDIEATRDLFRPDPGTASVDVPPMTTATADVALAGCCVYWGENHQSNFSGQDTKFVSSTQIAAAPAAFRLEANLAAGNITITSIFRWGTVAADVTDAEKADTITQFKARVAGWGGRFRMRIVDPVCGEKNLPLRFRLLWSPDDTAASAPFRVNLYRTYPRAGVTGNQVDIGYDSDVTPDSAWVLAHEYGHTLCLPDEYFYTGTTAATVTYKKADGTTEAVALEPAASNIMKTHGNRTYLNRFFYFAAIEAQELLRRESGRDVTCEIV